MRRLCFSFVAVLLFLVSCSLSDPTIADTNVYVVYEQQENGKTATMLSVFFCYKDDDGARDFSRMEVLCNTGGYSWTVDDSDILLNETDGLAWFGYPRLLPPSGQQLLAGTYTLTVYDLADNSTVTTFDLSSDDVSLGNNAPVTFPSGVTIDYDKNSWQTESEENSYRFVFFDNDMVPMSSYSTNNKHGRLDTLRSKSMGGKTARFYVLAENSKTAFSLTSFKLEKED